MASPEPYPVIVGVTGHRDIETSAVAGVAAVVEALLADLQAKCPDCLHVKTGIDTAADRIVARVATKLGIPRIVVRFEGAAAVDPLWQSAKQVVKLPRRCGIKPHPDDNRLFRTFMLRRSHIMLTLWDGALPDQDDLVVTPGDAAPVHAALRGRVDDSLMTGTESPLEADADTPWVQIMTPRSGWTPPPSGKWRLSACSVYEPDGILIASDVPPKAVFATLPEWHRKAIGSVNLLNDAMRKMGSVDRKTFDAQVEYLGLTANPAIADLDPAMIDRLVGWQCGADAVAQSYQRHLLGVWWPSRGFTDMAERVYAFVKTRGGRPMAGVQFWFAAAVPTAILLFESFAHLRSYLPNEWAYRALMIYIVILLFGLSFYYAVVRRNGWQDRFQDYRALAEAMRVQLFWSLCGLRAATADNYLHKHRLELGWIQYVQRGPALWAAEVARRVLASPDGPRRAIVVGNWIKDQQVYFKGAAERNAHSAHNHRLWLRVSVAFAAIAAILLGIVATLENQDVVWTSKHTAHLAKHGLVVAAATFPAIAAAFGISMEGRAFEGHAQSYRLMETIFSRALRVEPTIPDQRGFHSLMLDLGREALNETSEWLMDHRHRPIEHKAA